MKSFYSFLVLSSLFLVTQLSVGVLRGQSSEAELEVFRQRQLQGELVRIEKWSNYVAEAHPPTSDDELEELARGYSYFSSAASHVGAPYVVEAASMRDELRERLFSHPRHAQMFLERILAVERQLEDEEIDWLYAQRLFAGNFRRLAQMPTPQTVSCLASLLNERKGWFAYYEPGQEREFYRGQNPKSGSKSLAGWAVESLSKLDIAEDPVLVRHAKDPKAYSYGPNLGGDHFVEVWQDWWQEVVDGERTFSFRGDPRRYNHLGEVGPNWKPSRPTVTNPDSTTLPPQKKEELANLPKGAPSLALWLAIGLVAVALLTVVWGKVRNASRVRQIR